MQPGQVHTTQSRVPYLLALFATIGIALTYFTLPKSDLLTLLSNSIRPIAASASLLASLFALHNYWQNLDSKLTRIWLCFTVGMAFWFLSELTWATLTIGFNMPNPYPSIANVYRLVGYGALFIAIIIYIGMFHPVISAKTVAISAAAALPTSAGIIPTILLLISGKASHINSPTLFVTVAYPLLDLLLFATAVLGLLLFTITPLRGKLKGAWLLLNAGILMNVFGDLMLSYTNLSGIYYQGHPLELFFHIGYILFALAFYIHTKEL
jgi:hypothetical protein